MAKIDLQYDLVNYTPASASPVEANFNRVEQHINQEVIERGGTVAMTAQLKLVGDPVSPLDAAPKQYVDQVLPIGIVMIFGGVAAPPGGRWALCNGAELESVTYPELFAVLGNRFSPAGTPAGRFHLPNMTDRFPVGSGTFGAAGATGGNKDAVVPVHSHQHDHSHDYSHSHPAANSGTVSADHGHSFYVGSEGVSNGHQHATNVGVFFHDPYAPGFGVTVNQGQTLPANYAQVWTGDANANHSHIVQGGTGGINTNHVHHTQAPHISARTSHEGGRTANEGVAATNANLPPYLAMTYIMRVV